MLELVYRMRLKRIAFGIAGSSPASRTKLESIYMTEELELSFQQAAKPMLEWLNKNTDPHATVIINSTNAELMQGIISFVTFDFVKD